MSPSQAWLRPLLLLCAAAPAAVVTAQSPPLDWIDHSAIDAGEVEIRMDKGPRGQVLVDVAIRVDAPAKAVWDILVACEIAPEYVPNVVGCRRIDEINDGNSELFIQTVKPAFFIPRFEHVFRLDYHPPTRIDVHRVSGPIAQMDGSWWLLDQKDGSVLLMHTLALRPGLPVPRPFVRATLRRDLPTVLRAVRDRAEAAASN